MNQFSSIPNPTRIWKNEGDRIAVSFPYKWMIGDNNVGYNTKMGGYATTMSYMNELGEIVEEEHLMTYTFYSNRSLNDNFIIPAFLTHSIDNEVDNMNRKTITLDEDIIDVLNRKRLGGETWNDFFRRIVNYIPERNNWERGVKND